MTRSNSRTVLILLLLGGSANVTAAAAVPHAATRQSVPNVWNLISERIESAKSEHPPTDTYYPFPKADLRAQVDYATQLAGDAQSPFIKRSIIRKGRRGAYRVQFTQDLIRPILNVAAFRDQYANSTNDTVYEGLAINPGVLVDEAVRVRAVRQSVRDRYRFSPLGKAVRLRPWYDFRPGSVYKSTTNGNFFPKDPLHRGAVVIKTRGAAKAALKAGRLFIEVSASSTVRDSSYDPHHKAARYVHLIYLRVRGVTTRYRLDRVTAHKNVLYNQRLKRRS